MMHSLPAPSHHPTFSSAPRLFVRLWPLLLFLTAFVLYATTLAPGILGGDAGELQFAPAVLALPHPSGYPVQVLLNWLWLGIFPLGSVAWRTNLLSAVVAAAGVTVAGWTVAQSTTSRGAGMAAGVVLAVAPVYWSQAVLSDKYALNGLLTALLLAAAWRFYQHPRRGAAMLLAFAGGLAFAHHRSLWLFAPVVAGLILTKGWPLLRRPSNWLWSLLAFGVPLLVYLYVPWAAQRGLPPGHLTEMAWPRFWQYVLADGSAGQVRFAPDPAGLQLYWQQLRESFPLFWMIGAASGLWPAVRQRNRLGWMLFLATAFIVSAYLSAVYENYDLPRRYVYFVPSYVCLALLGGEGWAGWLAAWRAIGLGWRPPEHARDGHVIALSSCHPAILSPLLFLLALAPLFQLPQRWQVFRSEQHVEHPLNIWRQTLKSGGMADRLAAGLALAAPNALVVADWEQATPLWYAQQVAGQCPGCLILDPLHRLIDYAGRAAAEGRPLYVARTVGDAATWSHPTAVGPLVELQPRPGLQLPLDLAPVGAFFDGRVGLAGYVWPLGAPGIEAGRVLPVSLVWHDPRPPAAAVASAAPEGHPSPTAGEEQIPGYAISLRLVGPDGEVWKADNPAPVLGMHPFSAFAPGEVVLDYYEIPIPPDAPPGRYVVRVLLYEATADGGFRNARVTDAAGVSPGEYADVIQFQLHE